MEREDKQVYIVMSQNSMLEERLHGVFSTQSRADEVVKRIMKAQESLGLTWERAHFANSIMLSGTSGLMQYRIQVLRTELDKITNN